MSKVKVIGQGQMEKKYFLSEAFTSFARLSCHFAQMSTILRSKVRVRFGTFMMLLSWVKVFRIIPEFRILRLTDSNSFFDHSAYLKTIDHLNLELLIF